MLSLTTNTVYILTIVPPAVIFYWKCISCYTSSHLFSDLIFLEPSCNWTNTFMSLLLPLFHSIEKETFQPLPYKCDCTIKVMVSYCFSALVLPSPELHCNFLTAYLFSLSSETQCNFGTNAGRGSKSFHLKSTFGGMFKLRCPAGCRLR